MGMAGSHRVLFPRPDTRCCAFFLAFFLLGAGCGVALARCCAAAHPAALRIYLPALSAQPLPPVQAWVLTARFPLFLLLAAACTVRRTAAGVLVFVRGLLLAYLAACFYAAAPAHALGCVLLLLAVHGIFLLPLLLGLFTLAFAPQPQARYVWVLRGALCLLVSLLAALLERFCIAPLLQFLSR